jgi:hypothetical protein
MGIDVASAKFLLSARNHGVDFSRTLTIGRQGLHLSAQELRSVLHGFGIAKSRRDVTELFRARGYAEPFLELLGATTAASLDASGYEGATHVHDLNQPVPTKLREGFTAVFDGGSLEHVFEFPTALRNCMEMVAVGGHFLALTPANNYMGHGFYQLSPELFARVFREENGFRLERLLLLEQPNRQWYEVVDPAQAGRRVVLVNRRPTLMGIWARRIGRVEILTRSPQQSDYAAKWCRWSEQTGPRPRDCRESGRSRRTWLRRWLRRCKAWLRPSFPSKFYTPVDIAE